MNPFESDHLLGQEFKLLDRHAVLQNLIAQIGSPEITQPVLGILVNKAYEIILNLALNTSLEIDEYHEQTRMIEMTEKGVANFHSFDRNQKFSVIDLARAGTEPSQMCYETLNYLFKPENIRQDHIYINRKTNELSQVVGVDMSGSKIGGDFKDRVVVIPDPMGATGGTILHTINYIRDNFDCSGAKFLVLHLIMTPEYVRRIKKLNLEVSIFAGRYDRGLSSESVLQTKYGEMLEQETGLTDIQYIVPGAGGMGEVLNNSFV